MGPASQEVGMAPERMFKCGTLGLDASLRFGSLGGYDGAAAWALTLANIRDDDEQWMAELHEGLHHELQISSGWGLIASMAWLLAGRGFRKHSLSELFHVMVEESRDTHEMFATCLSAASNGVGRARELLADNPRYLDYLERGIALVDAGDAEFWQFHHAAISAVLRVCMRPAATFELLDRGFQRLTRRDLDLGRDGPDRRLSAFERLGGPSSWRAVFRDLLERYPDRGGDPAPGYGRRLPEAPEALERLHRFEGEVLLPRCHAHACAVLGSAGFPSVSSREQSRLAMALRSAVIAVDPALAEQVVLATERRPLFEEALDFERQQVVLRDRLPVQVVPVDETLRDPAAFRSGDSSGDQHACALWIDRQVARKQFAFPDGVELPELVTALTARAGAAGDNELVRVGLLPAGISPQECQQALGRTPLLVLTTHATLARHGQALAMLQAVEPVFVLMDLPVGRHVGHWIRQGATVRVWVSPIGRTGGRLGVATFAINRRHPFVFFRVGSEASGHVLVDQLRQRHPGSVEDNEAARDDGWRAALGLAVDHVLSTWQVLDQQGGR
jgi:hypothetical protein